MEREWGESEESVGREWEWVGSEWEVSEECVGREGSEGREGECGKRVGVGGK